MGKYTNKTLTKQGYLYVYHIRHNRPPTGHHLVSKAHARLLVQIGCNRHEPTQAWTNWQRLATITSRATQHYGSGLLSYPNKKTTSAVVVRVLLPHGGCVPHLFYDFVRVYEIKRTPDWCKNRPLRNPRNLAGVKFRSLSNCMAVVCVVHRGCTRFFW